MLVKIGESFVNPDKIVFLRKDFMDSHETEIVFAGETQSLMVGVPLSVVADTLRKCGCGVIDGCHG